MEYNVELNSNNQCCALNTINRTIFNLSTKIVTVNDVKNQSGI